MISLNHYLALSGVLFALGFYGVLVRRSALVLRALVHGLWERPDLDLDSMEPFAPDQAAYAVTDVLRREGEGWLLAWRSPVRLPHE